jgi:hypothetical protein
VSWCRAGAASQDVLAVHELAIVLTVRQRPELTPGVPSTSGRLIQRPFLDFATT